ncbi:hypothetical protein P691DRAFT_768438 [Macrolepiota fuliginosa MF-IS2]|uniref:Uncharacterized protein n=1 Tax=Macrolepiota fuliginosa MF-IS2 TaxID=1400762 RepID=A0A9P5WW74_9AGAR|nr:hypothetical protein P691DRAFT_768438 [Macrolepiota fuliginosa MF-IS2]
MPRKPKSKLVDNATNAPAFKPSDATQRFLAVMNQNCHAASSFTINEYSNLVPPAWRSVVMDDLLHMQFKLATPPIAPTTSAPIEVNSNNRDESDIDELSPTEELLNAIATFGQWFESNNITDNDIPMEPIAPTHAFSEAASQTPAPSLKASMPPPLPTTVAISPAAVASIPPSSPHGHASYAGTAAKNLNPAAPPFVHGPPHAPVQPPAQAQQPVSSKHSKWPFYATCGPSRHQFFIEVPSIPKDTSLPSMVKMANTSLACAKSALWVDSACFSPRSIMCATASIPSTLDLDIIKAMLSGRLLGACVCIPASQSFIKVVDVPFFKPGTTKPIPSAEVGAQLQCSIIHKSNPS